MINPLCFYERFQVNYFDYKILTLNSALTKIYSDQETGFEKVIYNYSVAEYKNALKSDIRQTYFQAIETLFTLVFCLEPKEDNVLVDNILLDQISQKNYYAKRIEKISKKPEEALGFLNTIVNYKSVKYTLGNHIFYFGLPKMPKNKDDATIEQNLNAIKKGLILLAKDLADTREYNSYKHGLRIFPLLKEFGLGFNEEELPEQKWNLSDSMTFYHRDDKQKKVHFVTKPFDTVRDINMTMLCSTLIGNIILLRKRWSCCIKCVSSFS